MTEVPKKRKGLTIASSGFKKKATTTSSITNVEMALTMESSSYDLIYDKDSIFLDKDANTDKRSVENSGRTAPREYPESNCEITSSDITSDNWRSRCKKVD